MKGSALAIIEALGSGMDRVKQLVTHTGLPLNQVYARLHDLKRLQAVRSFRVRGGQRGRAQREKRYTLRNGVWCLLIPVWAFVPEVSPPNHLHVYQDGLDLGRCVTGRTYYSAADSMVFVADAVFVGRFE
jgi:hypothetical protein